MDTRVLARIAAIVFVAIVLTAAAVEIARQEEEPARAEPAPTLQPPADPLREGQRRCLQMGDAAATDAECLAIWAETRDRFLGRDPSRPAPRQNAEH